MTEILRVANCSGYFGDRHSAAREMVTGGDIDVLTGDYLAELTMLILWKSKAAGRPGYARTFLHQMEKVLGECLERGIRIVANAGGLDPNGLATELQTLGSRLGLSPKIAYITGDDLMPRLNGLGDRGVDFRNLDTDALLADSAVTPVTANAYLGGRGIAKALEEGSDIVVCPRVTDASLVVGPSMWKFGWRADEYEKIAGAIAAGHVIECGAQATGGNYAFYREVETPVAPGFPIAEMYADGSSIITKHAGTGGECSVGTVTAQLVYEIGEAEYHNPDATLLLDSLRLDQEGPDRVRISQARGQAPPPTIKVSMSCLGTYRQSATFSITGDDIVNKAKFAEASLLAALGGPEQFDDVDFHLFRRDRIDATTNELAVAELVANFSSADPDKLGRRIFDAAVGIGLSTFPGAYLSGERSHKPTQIGVHWPFTVGREEIVELVHLPDGQTAEIRYGELTEAAVEPEPHVVGQVDVGSNHADVPLGLLFGARSGDKGANANVGIWARSEAAHAWLHHCLSIEEFRVLLPEADNLKITRTALPNLRAVNFVIHGLLGDGAAAGSRFDSQAKGLGEFIRSRTIRVPESLLNEDTAIEHPQDGALL